MKWNEHKIARCIRQVRRAGFIHAALAVAVYYQFGQVS